MLSLFITWDVSPEIFNIGGFSVRYYGVLFALAFILGYKIEEKMFKSEGLSQKWLDKLWIYVAVATVVGARLGHCIFYDWAYYSDHIVEMVLPVRFEPEFRFTGYQGLASHGAAIGIIVGLWYYSRKVSRKSILWVLDRAVIPIALAGFFIRTGNLMNSEIVGQATDMPWGFRFIHSGMPDPETPRHPAQLYEALCYLVAFFVLMRLYWKINAKEKPGCLFGVFLVLVFTARFLIEFVKEDQEAFEASMPLNMGQLLSIPFVLVGVAVILYSVRRYRAGTPSRSEAAAKR